MKNESVLDAIERFKKLGPAGKATLSFTKEELEARGPALFIAWKDLLEQNVALLRRIDELEERLRIRNEL